MSTIIQRWSDVKNGIIEQVARIDSCIIEAISLIKKNTGQQQLKLVVFLLGKEEEDDFCKSKVELSYYGRTGIKINTGSSGLLYQTDLKLEKHWYGPLSKYEEIHTFLLGITTGTIIEAWEKQQE